MKWKLIEYCNGEAIKVKTCLSKAEANNTMILWRTAPCENQHIEVVYLGDDEN